MDSDIEARELRAAYGRGDEIICVHYACENFYEVKDRPVAVRCIAISRPHGGPAQSFHLTDRKTGTSEEREEKLLDDFYRELQRSPDARIVHWNMSSASYGFAALERRYQYLTDRLPEYAPKNDRLHDLDSLIGRRYGDRFVRDPKLRNLASLNDCSLRFFRSGKDEAKEADDGDLAAVYRSTEEKSRIIGQLLHRFCAGTLRTQNSVGSVPFAGENLDAVAAVVRVGGRFRDVERSLKRRHSGRGTLVVEDEYDAQDLMRSLLTLFFDDIRSEDPVPSTSGASSRVDFVIPDFSLAIELKHARDSMTAKTLGEELMVDVGRYQGNPGIRHLVCLVFDHDGPIPNPRGIERDLSVTSSSAGVAVTVKIFDR